MVFTSTPVIDPLLIDSNLLALLPITMATARIAANKQTLDDAYAPPANFLEIDLSKPEVHGFGSKRFCDYEVKMKTNLPVFKLKDAAVRRRCATILIASLAVFLRSGLLIR